MRLGDVEILPFTGGEDLAQFVAFAASVEWTLTSKIEAIEAIGRALGDFTKTNPSVMNISVPLLGAGAGGLAAAKVASALRKGFLATTAAGTSLIIHVLHREVFDQLKSDRQQIKGKSKPPPVRVFLSHTSKTKESIDWVKSLALHLIEQGIQARLDQFHLRRGMDLPQWMSNELQLASKVIVICDENYKQKADGRLGGVGWETMIIQGDLSNLPPDSTKYQIIVRAEHLQQGLPLYLRTKYAFHAPPTDGSQSFRQDLLQELRDDFTDPFLEQQEISL